MPRLVIHAAFEVHPDYIEECKTLFKEVTRESLAEVGTEYYVLTQSITNPAQFRVFEIYTSEATFEDHFNTTFQKVAKWAAREGVMVGAVDLQKHVLNEDVEKGIVTQ